jgi:hypothetical protein
MKVGLAIVLLVLAVIFFGCLGSSLEECEKLGNQYQKDACYRNASFERNDSSLCGKVQYNRDGCYYKLLEKDPDRRLCDLIDKKSGYKTDCYLLAAVNSNKSEWCDPASPEEIVYKDIYEAWKADCYLRVAVQNKDTKTCDRITGEASDALELKDLCYALAKRNLGSCESLKSDSAREECYLEFAILNRDISLCEKLTLRNNRSSYYMTGKEHCINSGDPTRESCYCKVWWTTTANEDIKKWNLTDSMLVPQSYYSSIPSLALPLAIDIPAPYELGLTYSKAAVTKIAKAADEVYKFEPGSKRTAQVTIPYNSTNLTIAGNEVSIGIYNGVNVIDVYEDSVANLTGCINYKVPGNHEITVEAIRVGDEIKVRISDSLGCG